MKRVLWEVSSWIMPISNWLYGWWWQENDFKNKPKKTKNKNQQTLNLIHSPAPHHHHHHSQLYIKGTRFSKVSVPFLKCSVFHGSSIPSQRWSGAQVREKNRSTLARSKEEQLNAHTTNLLIRLVLFCLFCSFVHHHTLHWLGWEFTQDARGEKP